MGKFDILNNGVPLTMDKTMMLMLLIGLQMVFSILN